MHIVTNNNNKVITVLVKFDNDHIGLKAIQSSPYCATYTNTVPSKYEVQSSPYCATYTNTVPLAKYEVVLPAKGKKKAQKQLVYNFHLR